ncbi:unnamed protein product [Pelagomonas calceolata]|uniref:SET domain-containing protein n=1 Tax=Pelagomonas calceolata TaxID=35677 RepID=A0A8J2WUH5_9STRA|nr:unnamed protein product [Pelagomonas calceolata]
MAQTTKPKAKKPSRTARLAKIRARADEIGRAIRIRKSRIAAGGGGAFTTVPIKRGECVGFYLGAAGKRSENRDYIVEGDGGPSRDAYDEAGRLVVDGRKVNCHDWTADDWTKLKKEATWAGVESSWTRRFINHASAAHQNVALCTDSGHRFGRSHAFYAKADIPAHSELYFSYGAGYWSARGIVPEDPAQE